MGKRKNKKRIDFVIGIVAIVVLGIVGIFNGNIQDNENNITNNNVANSKAINNENVILSDLSSIPEYSETPYVVLNNNVPNFNEEDYNKGIFENYSELDSLGRCGVAYANICLEIMPKADEERGEIGMIKPSGWETKRYNGMVDGNYLYNRCHLIGWQLAGENANEKNLITGTRYMNVEGMLPFENMVDDYFEKEENKNNHVLYRVTPIYEGNNLVANGVQMEAYSIEDQGQGICFNVYVYNVQPGITINYETGTSEIAT